MKNITLCLTILLGIAQGCKTIVTKEGEKIKPFTGTILYDVKVEQKSDSSFEKDKQALYGTEMHLTVFKNGNLQRQYIGAAPTGFAMHYIDIKNQEILKKYNSSDSLYVYPCSIQNIRKIGDLRGEKIAQTVINYELNQIAITAQEAPSRLNAGRYLTIKYWYTDALKIDKTNYQGVNDDLVGYFLNQADGSIYLKYEIDYFTYKVTYTAKELLPGTYEKTKELLEEAPKVSN